MAVPSSVGRESTTDVSFSLQNGQSIIDKFIGKEYSRVRIGIGKPENKISVSDYVLNDFNEDEQVHLDSITNNILESLSILIDKKLDLFSSTVNNN